uniref:Cupin-like domain-containing protein n=1 Tax=viral metagenome TaxID=1070528 RepID=A0A6C0AXD4_9ZZZZ|tara:strand:+ start:1600 stop:2733 length:1134 start_codon:yes stop_codon:yes gene_type:complete
MSYIFELLIFLIVCFLYIHIFYHLKVSNSLEVYEIDDCTKDRFEDICNLRQPFVGKSSIVELNNLCNLKQLDNIYSAFEVKVRNNTNTNSKYEDLYYPLKWRNAKELIRKDKEQKYICERNQEFLEETEIVKDFQRNDGFLRPSMVSNCKYDILMGSKNSYTPFRYELSFRTFFYTLEGNITVKLCPPKNNKYLYEFSDYELFEFRSEINPWDVNSEYKDNFDKVKMLEINLTAGEYLFIPAYWWYSIKYNSSDVLIGKFQYYTYMNNLALIPKYMMYVLQNQNIRHRFLGTRVENNNELPKVHDNENIQTENVEQQNNNDDNDDDGDNIENNDTTKLDPPTIPDLSDPSLILSEQKLMSDTNIESYDSGTSNMLEL